MNRLDSEPYRFSGPHRAPLAALFARAADAPDREMPGLDDAVRAFAREARFEGIPSERVVIALKDIATGAAPGRADLTDYRRLVERLVVLTIDTYYRAD